LIREKNKPWFSNEIRKEIRIRDRIRKKLLESQNENNIIKYKKQRNKVNNMKKIAKEKCENNLDNFLFSITRICPNRHKQYHQYFYH
jgi:hypothetical protein